MWREAGTMDVTAVLMGFQAADPNVRVQAEQQLEAAKQSNLVRTAPSACCGRTNSPLALACARRELARALACCAA